MSALRGQGVANSATRAIIAGGDGSGGKVSSVEQVTIASKGNSKDFGELTQRRRVEDQNISSSTRGVFVAEGWGNGMDIIDYMTIASAGNAIDFGNLVAASYLPATCSSHTRGIIGGGTPSSLKTVQYVTISSAGNAIHFGDLSEDRYAHTAVSDSHGGLGGY